MQQERTSANSGRLRLHEIQHELHSDCCINGRTARAQHFEPRLDRMAVRCRHHVLFRHRKSFRRGACCRLRRAARALGEDGRT